MLAASCEEPLQEGGHFMAAAQELVEDGECYRPRYLNIQRPNYLRTIRHNSARIAGNPIT